MKPVTHYPPSPDGLTKCCGKQRHEIYGNKRKGDRFASDPALVTCPGGVEQMRAARQAAKGGEH